jgi:hypothetical protein
VYGGRGELYSRLLFNSQTVIDNLIVNWMSELSCAIIFYVTRYQSLIVSLIADTVSRSLSILKQTSQLGYISQRFERLFLEKPWLVDKGPKLLVAYRPPER